VQFDKKFLKTLIVLYAEDDEHARNSLVSVLDKLFKKVFIAKDGQEGLDYYSNNHEIIDVVISDINMPNLSGMGMLEGIRRINQTVPFIFTTAHQENEFLLSAIKFGVYHYANKPVDIKEIIHKVQIACFVKYERTIAAHNLKQSEEYLNIINQVAVVSRISTKGEITYVNDMFCAICGYEEEELIGEQYTILKDKNFTDEVYTELWKRVNEGQKWTGKLKSVTKDNEEFYMNVSVFPQYDEFDHEILGFMSIGFLTTDDENEKRKYKAYIRQIVMVHKKEISTYSNEIKTLNQKIKNFEVGILQEKSEKNESKSRDLLKQLAFYEEKIKNLDDEKLTVLEKSKSNYIQILNKNSGLVDVNDKQLNTIRTYEYNNEAQSNEIIKLKEQLDTQTKLIYDLKDVISFTEKELEISKSKNQK
jgi:PAS domain S-box-containing protein